MKFLKLRDIIIIAIVAAIAVMFYLFFPQQEGNTATVQYNGDTVTTVNLDSYRGSVDIPQQPQVDIEVTEEGIKFVHSDCPDKVCVNTGFISNSGQVAACLPNRIVISVSSDKEDGTDVVI